MTAAARPLFDPARLRTAMEAAGLDAVVAHSRRNFYYLSSFLSLDYAIDAESANFVIVPRDPARPASVTIPMSEYLSLEAEPIWVPHKIFCGRFYVKDGPAPDGATAANTFEGMIQALKSGGLSEGRVGFELEQLPVTWQQELMKALPALKLADASPLIRNLRMIKTPEEVRRIRMACEITEQAIDEVIPRIRSGMTDMEVAAQVAAGIVTRGAEVLYVQVAMPAAAGLGPPAGRTIHRGDIVRMDVAAVYQGYNSDLGRGCVVGTPTPEQREHYRVAYQALQAGIAAVRPGRPAEEIFAAGMAVWAAEGFPHVRRHHIGHGIGLQAHEVPLLKPGVTTPIEPGMVLAVEVPYYVYNFGGFAPEDILAVGPEGTIQFTHAPAELPVAGA